MTEPTTTPCMPRNVERNLMRRTWVCGSPAAVGAGVDLALSITGLRQLVWLATASGLSWRAARRD
jgi:hypothetical protein